MLSCVPARELNSCARLDSDAGPLAQNLGVTVPELKHVAAGRRKAKSWCTFDCVCMPDSLLWAIKVCQRKCLYSPSAAVAGLLSK